MIKKNILSPFQKFVQIESFSGILLFIATIIALIWANSSFGESYQSLWQYKIRILIGSFISALTGYRVLRLNPKKHE